MIENSNPTAAAVLRAAFSAWQAGATLRASRHRNKCFTYGDQWIDTSVDEHGRHVSDYERYCRDGGFPITNNLLRQLIKTVVGRYRATYLHESADDGQLTQGDTHVTPLDELDSRALEEFLISGCCVQRVEPERNLLSTAARVDNVDINTFFVNRFVDPLGRDIELVGQLHELSISRLIQRVARGDRRRAAWVRRLYSRDCEQRVAECATQLGVDPGAASSFWHAGSSKCRAIEVWTLESHEVLVCHNRDTAEVTLAPLSAMRRLSRNPALDIRWDIDTRWHCRWFTPMGDLLSEELSQLPHGGHPFVIRFYPLTDGEVHAFIEDVIDQQKYVNRLITLIDHIMQASAKGVLLYPEAALPDGFSWDDIRRVWSSCRGILPYSAEMGGGKPEQLSVNNTDIGAFDMIQLQLKLLEEISGVGGALQGKNINTQGSVNLYRSEVLNASVALTDVFDTFNAWRAERNALLAKFN